MFARRSRQTSVTYLNHYILCNLQAQRIAVLRYISVSARYIWGADGSDREWVWDAAVDCA
jgi:hypothetical protein